LEQEMKNMVVGKKISLAFGVLLALTILLGTLALISANRMHRYQEATVTDAMPGIYEISRADSVAKDMQGRMLMHISSTSQTDMAQVEADIAKMRDQFKDIMKEYEKTIFRPLDREMFGRIEPAYDRYFASWEPIRAVSRQSKNAEAFALYKQNVMPAFQEFQKAIADEVEQNKSYGDECATNSINAYSNAKWGIWACLLFSILAGSGLGFWIVRGMNSTLRQSATELAQGAGEITSAASQVASSSQSLAQGASEQAASLEETSASSEEITSMTRKNAENSRSAADLMASVDHQIKQGNQTLEQMVVSMQEINSSSDKISKIIKVIDEIAFQTNILALNAAVEAARAGEAGMGFAVVADEVRNLAQRSAQAAKDTAGLIEESIGKSNEGSTKLQAVAQVIRSITESAAKVKVLVDEVNLGSQEQARGIEQIAKAVAQMDQLTQTTASSAEESASASEELSAQAQALNHIVLRLGVLVGGVDQGLARASAPAAPTPAPAKRALGGRGLDAMKCAVSRQPNALTTSRAEDFQHAEDFPMDDTFVES
jgi:methyl-accepting chemotaxis protein